jgi:uncharacterized repeat protein (TIGR01451 family)
MIVRLLLLLAVLGVAGFALAGTASPRPAAVTSPIEELVSGCPPAADVAAIDATVRLQFDGDPTAGTSVCTAAQSGRSLSLLQERVYHSLQVMRSLRYSRPLPWTSASLYDWFVHAIRGVRFRNDIDYSSCCEPGSDTIWIQTKTLAVAQTNLPKEFSTADLALNFISLLAHEARHNEGKSHTCGFYDQTLDEQGAIAVQVELALWDALYSDSFLDNPDVRSRFRDGELAYAMAVQHSICGLGDADLASSIVASPETVAPGGALTLAATVANGGPADAPGVVLVENAPKGTKLVSATPSQGSCVLQTDRTVCELGTVASGAAATVKVVYTVTSARGTVQYPGPDAGVAVYAQVHDPANGNDVASTSFVVNAPATTTTTTARRHPKCKKGQKSTVKRPCRK